MQWSNVHWIVVQFRCHWVDYIKVKCSADHDSALQCRSVQYSALSSSFSFAFCAVFYEVDWPGYDILLRNSVIRKCIKLFQNTATWTVAITIIYIYMLLFIFFNVGSLLNNKKFHELFLLQYQSYVLLVSLNQVLLLILKICIRPK